mmetsp:Transcript_3950/g.11222  ORF Transcript_3950/g.11222 Transcript_3950/m.11222 type:complete len:360 (+) Transcript_3950:180-1259(+)
MSAADDGDTTDDGDVKVVLEQTLLTCPEVFVYRIPPMMTSGGHRAEDWNLAKPLETCSLVVMRRDDSCLLHLMSEKPKKGGPPGATEPHLFAKCRIQLDFRDPTKKIEHWVEAVVDSSRYSVVRIGDDATGREAHIGMGFRERTDAVTFRMSLQEYENALRRERKAEAMHDAYERSHCHPDGGGEGSAVDGSGGGSGAPPGGDSLTPPPSAGGPTALPAVSKLTLKEGEKIHVKIKGMAGTDHGSGGGGSGSGGLRKSTALGLSGRKGPPAGALTCKGGLLLKKPPSDRQVVASPVREGNNKPTGSSATSTTSSSGASTPESNEPPPTAAAAEAGSGGGSKGADDDSDDDFGDFEEAGN